MNNKDMKKRFLVLFSALILLFCCCGKSNAQVKIKGEIGVGLFSLNAGLYTVLEEHHVAGVSGAGIFVFPSLAGQISPQYRYYFSGYKGNSNGFSGSFFLNAGMNFWIMKDLHAESPEKNTTRAGNSLLVDFYYFNVGGGYELRYKKFYIRPTLNAMFPNFGSSSSMILASVFTASALQASMGFRF